MKNKRGKILVNIDWITIAIVFILMIVGWVSIYAAVYDEHHKSIFDLSQRYGKQLLWILVSIPIIFSLFIIDSKFYSTFAYPLYAIGIVLLILVLLFGIEVNASKSWFVVGSFRVQPAEFVKFMLSLAVARMLSGQRFSFNNLNSIIKIGALMALPIGLVMLQNDTGTALVFFALIFVFYREGLNSILFYTGLALIALFVLALIVEPCTLLLSISFIGILAFYILSKNISGKRVAMLVCTLITISAFFIIHYFETFWHTIIIAIIASLIIILALIVLYLKTKDKIPLTFALIILFASMYVFSVEYSFENFLQEHQKNRINQILGKHHDPLGVGYNLNQSKIAIGSGGLYGKGFLMGTQTKFNFVPEQSTDFIFCTIGEEFGFLGSLTVVSLYVILLLRLVFLAERQRSSFSRIYGYCVVSILFFHIIINIGMTIGLVPIIGIPLPFLSYGGSSLWAFTVLIFVFLKLDSNRLEVFR